MLIERSSLSTPSVVKAAQAHARACYPNEALGVIAAGRYEPLQNASKVPTAHVVPEPEQWLQTMQRDDVQAIIHSHPNGPFFPTERDMMSQIDIGKPCGLLAVYGDACSGLALWGDQLVRPALNGRGFQHGITDCYEAIRDWYFDDRGWCIMQFCRSWNWWLHGGDLYSHGFARAGFGRVPHHESRRGDVLLFKYPYRGHNNRLLQDKITHGAVCMGNGSMYNHPTDATGFALSCKSGIEPIGDRARRLAMVVRPDPNHPAIIEAVQRGLSLIG